MLDMSYVFSENGNCLPDNFVTEALFASEKSERNSGNMSEQ
jgi:hypothetical protein